MYNYNIINVLIATGSEPLANRTGRNQVAINTHIDIIRHIKLLANHLRTQVAINTLIIVIIINFSPTTDEHTGPIETDKFIIITHNNVLIATHTGPIETDKFIIIT